MAIPYIPPADALYLSWLTNFATLIAANPAAYGLVAGDAASITAQDVSYSTAYAVAIDPPTRTAPTVAAKDAARAVSEAVVRPYAINIRNNAGISNQAKLDVGVTVPDLTPTPVPAPATAPVLMLVMAQILQHQLQFRDALTPLLKMKPMNVIGCQIYRAIGTVAAVDPSQASYFAVATKTPFLIPFDGADRGKVCTYFARWNTRSGPSGIAQVGPWSTSLVVGVI